MAEKVYVAIDLKSFYASAECVARGLFALMGGFLACKFCPPFCVDSIIDLISRVFFANIRPTWSGFGHSPVISRHSTPVKLELHLEADDQRTICRHGHEYHKNQKFLHFYTL